MAVLIFHGRDRLQTTCSSPSTHLVTNINESRVPHDWEKASSQKLGRFKALQNFLTLKCSKIGYEVTSEVHKTSSAKDSDWGPGFNNLY